jgi:hypothetical protein
VLSPNLQRRIGIAELRAAHRMQVQEFYRYYQVSCFHKDLKMVGQAEHDLHKQETTPDPVLSVTFTC